MNAPSPGLSRRERQILDILFARGSATVADVLAALPDPPSYSSVRALLRVLESKGHVLRQRGGDSGSAADNERAHVYAPREARQQAARTALRGVVETFFGGSVEKAVAALLAPGEAAHLTESEIARLAALINAARPEPASIPTAPAPAEMETKP